MSALHRMLDAQGGGAGGAGGGRSSGRERRRLGAGRGAQVQRKGRPSSSVRGGGAEACGGGGGGDARGPPAAVGRQPQVEKRRLELVVAEEGLTAAARLRQAQVRWGARLLRHRVPVQDGQSSVYPASTPRDHTVHLQSLSPGSSLLGHHGQLCGGFYHTAPSTEAANPRLCLDEELCAKAPSCILVVRVDEWSEENSSWAGPTFVARYHNCYRGYEDSVHAEQFMIADPALLAALGGDPSTAMGAADIVGSHARGSGARDSRLPSMASAWCPSSLSMFITSNCHQQDSRDPACLGHTSCTNRILEWKRGTLSEPDGARFLLSCVSSPLGR